MSGDKVDFLEKIDAKEGVFTWSKKNFRVENGIVYYKDEPIHEVLNNYILEIIKDGYECDPLLLFVENLYKNTSLRCVNDLFSFLQHRNMPITEDGCFLGYKAVRSDFMDKWTGTINNSVGRRIKMPRNKVMDDPEVGCSYGLHVGSLEYAQGYSSDDDVLLIVKVNPKDVVSVPNEDSKKLRCCEYKVVSLFSSPLSNSYDFAE